MAYYQLSLRPQYKEQLKQLYPLQNKLDTGEMDSVTYEREFSSKLDNIAMLAGIDLETHGVWIEFEHGEYFLGVQDL